MNPDRAGQALNPYERYVAWCRMLGFPLLSEEEYERLLQGVQGMVVGQERLGPRGGRIRKGIR